MQVVLAALLAIGCAVAGAVLAGGKRARVLVPFSGGLLAAIALFALIPETAEDIGWPVAVLAAAAGYGLLHLFDRYGVPVCPSCSHSHGFSGPLVTATAVHAFVDGWGMVAIRNSLPNATTHEATGAIVAALLVHKIPEGLALGAILRMSEQKPGRAVLLSVLAEGPTVIGGMVGLWAEQARWIDYPLAAVGGAYLFLGFHAIRAWLRPVHAHNHASNLVEKTK